MRLLLGLCCASIGFSQGYYLDGGQKACPTFSGTPRNLLNALDVHVALVEKMGAAFTEPSKCSLRITCPSTKTLDALVQACFSCHDNPGTFGVDWDANAFFAIKTFSDMKILLKRLAELLGSGDTIARSVPTQDFALHHLGYPKGVF